MGFNAIWQLDLNGLNKYNKLIKSTNQFIENNYTLPSNISVDLREEKFLSINRSYKMPIKKENLLYKIIFEIVI